MPMVINSSISIRDSLIQIFSLLEQIKLPQTKCPTGYKFRGHDEAKLFELP